MGRLKTADFSVVLSSYFMTGIWALSMRSVLLDLQARRFQGLIMSTCLPRVRRYNPSRGRVLESNIVTWEVMAL